MKNIKILLLSALIWPLSAFTQNLDDYLIIAAKNNSNLEAEYLNYQAALQRVQQVGTLPDPQLSFNIFIMPMERYMGDHIASISIMQMFPWLGTLDAAEDEMAYLAKAKLEEFYDAKSKLFFEVKANWYALQILENEIIITKENIELLKTIEKIAISRLKSGGSHQGGSNMKNSGTQSQSNTMSDRNIGMNNPRFTVSSQNMNNTGTTTAMTSNGYLLDLLRVQMEINILENNLAILTENKIPLLAHFNMLLNRPVNEEVIISDSIPKPELPISIYEIPDSIRSNNPMLKMLEQKENAFLAQEDRNRKIGLPMIGVGLQYNIFKPRGNSESMMNGKNMIMPMATVTIPLWRKKYNASVRESQFLRQSAAAEKQDISNRLMVSYEDALKDFRNAERRLNLYQEQTLLANQALNILIVQYSVEGRKFEEVIRMQQQLLDYRLKELEALIDGNISVAMIESFIGR